MRIVLAGCLVSACSHASEVSLRGFSPGELRTTVTADGAMVSVELVLLRSNDCAILAGAVTATLDDAPLEIVTRGSYIPPAATDAASACENPTLQGTPSAATTSRIVITDGASTIAATIGSLAAPRAFTVGAVQRGTAAHFTWSVSGDTPGSLQGAPYTPRVAWIPDQGAGFGIGGAPPTGPAIDGTSVIAAIPADATTGSGTFTFDKLFGPTVISCEGIASCDTVPPDPPPLRATIAP